MHLLPHSRVLIIGCVLLFCSSCNSIFNNRRIAYRQIGEMKNTVVLVKLKSSTNKIEALQQEGKHDEATALAQEIQDTNIEIKQAFEAEFDFCDYYFFDVKSYDAIWHKDYANINLTDIKDEEVLAQDVMSEGFYIVTFEGSYPTTFVTVDQNGRRHQVGGTGGIKRRPTTVVLDEDFVQLIKPFPYTGGYPIRTEENKVSKMVMRLNYSLTEFYDENRNKIEQFKNYTGTY